MTQPASSISRVLTGEFRRVAILNRGEAAMRFIRGAKTWSRRERVPLETIALYTSADTDAPFVQAATHAVALPDPAPGQPSPYVNIDLLLDTAQAAGADAIWPGWGFVSEDPALADACQARGLVFLGPPASATVEMADKVSAKQLAERCDVPVAPWSKEPVADVDVALAALKTIGFPALLKSAAGGGGRGIRLVHNPDQVEDAFKSASAEALATSGNAALFIERYITEARHVEVQVLADTHGNVWTLGTRDCSVQRRNQKLLEEAPAPGLPNELSQSLESCARRLARACGYVGVGTVEYLVLPTTPGHPSHPDSATSQTTLGHPSPTTQGHRSTAQNNADLTFVFLEMNTRLQVEHTVTEAIFGIDLVAAQIDVARGLDLSTRTRPEPRGVAVEARLNAEDPDDGFAPRTGQILRFVAPDGPWIRVDTGYAEGNTIPSAFDSNVAKIITWGINRQDALARLHSALDDTVLAVETGLSNRALLRELVADSDFHDGPVTTAWLDAFLASRPRAHQRHQLAIALAAAAIGDHLATRRQELRLFFAQALTGLPRRLSAPGPRELSYRVDGTPIDITIATLAPMTYLASSGPWEAIIEARPTGNAHMVLTIGSDTYQVIRVARPDHVVLEVNGVAHRLEKRSDGNITAPIPAAISQIHVEPGQRVSSGQRLITLEAMKMEFPVVAPIDGVVEDILATRSASVEAGQPLLRLQPDSDASADDAPLVSLALPTQSRRPLSTAEVLHAQLLGYDVDPALAATALDTLLDHPERLQPAELLDLFATYCAGESLFWHGLEDDAANSAGESSADQLARFLRQRHLDDEHLSERFTTKLRLYLASHGLKRDHECRPGERLDHALMRLLQARKDRRLRDRLATEVLRTLLSPTRSAETLTHPSSLEQHFGPLHTTLPSLLEALAGDVTRRRRWELAALVWQLRHALELDASAPPSPARPTFWDDPTPALTPPAFCLTPTQPGVEPSPDIALRSWSLTATDTPDDHRLWVEVCVAPSHDNDLDLLSLKRAFLQAATALRHHIAKDTPAPSFNRIILSYIGNLNATDASITELARQLSAQSADLDLELTLLRCSAGLSLNARPCNAIIFGPATGIGASFADVDTLPPAPALTSADRGALQAHRRGLFHPSEVITWLTGGQTSPGFHAAIAGSSPHTGTFEEWDLDARNNLTPTSRTPGQHQANLVVGLITNTRADASPLTRVLIIGDATRTMGSLGEAECRRICLALDLARERNLPVEWVALSSGARIAMDSGTENLDWTARVLRRIVEMTQDGHPIHVIVDGPCVGAQSYWNAEATMLMHCKGALIMTPRGYMILTGRKALEFSGSVSAESNTALGGAPIMVPNGEAQYEADDLIDAYRTLFAHYRLTRPGVADPRQNSTSPSTQGHLSHTEFSPQNTTQGHLSHTLTDRSSALEETDRATSLPELEAIFDPEQNPGKKKPFAIRTLMQSVLDPGAPTLERWAALQGGESAVVWLGELGGQSVTMIGIESQPIQRRGPAPVDGPDTWMSGTLFPHSSRKIARAINAASGVQPLVILANLSGFDGSPESLRERQLEWGAEIARAVINFEGPILFNVVARYHGGAFVVFSQALNENLHATALDHTYASVIGGAPAAAVVFPGLVQRRLMAHPDYPRIETIPTPAQRRAALQSLRARIQAELASEFDQIHNVQRARDVGSIHDIIAPDQLREHIITRLTQE
ncbi:ATP-grasp domain-containing protein [Lujinxingia vulgaris]|uniref:biotin carboxylase n=1 Tax=Lujinxingia vulgaris TaxID=2600176 RepID=A0A5C6X2T3_9DELT|nr:carboxyl transferase domain-containing protein [Lujinxingia vulgaris]TXD36133.1 ATP-grasp domain-containing protein [Lujinxingia vulgaris]